MKTIKTKGLNCAKLIVRDIQLSITNIINSLKLIFSYNEYLAHKGHTK